MPLAQAHVFFNALPTLAMDMRASHPLFPAVNFEPWLLTTLEDVPVSAPPPQQQAWPGTEEAMTPHPLDENEHYVASGRLKGKVAIITGGDSGIGRATAILFAKEGADLCLVYFNEHKDAEKTARRIKELGRRVITIAGDIGDPSFCRQAVGETLEEFHRIDILINNAAVQKEIEGVGDLTPEQLERTFRTNIFGFIHFTRATLPHLKKGAAIVNTTSIQALYPQPYLMDYACTKAAILNFTQSLAKEVADKGIRVNAVAPGPIWTPLIPATFSAEHVAKFGKNTLLKRPGQPFEVAPCYLFLASEADSSYMTGQVLHPNGGSNLE
jgi:NAD(P)-dependent dehydrogenase (short-subunit alcohol dehydrogenase family)